MKCLMLALAVLIGSAGCQSSDNGGGGTPSSVGNGQTRNNGPFAPDSNPPASPAASTTRPSSY
jgi:hypothetical protein